MTEPPDGRCEQCGRVHSLGQCPQGADFSDTLEPTLVSKMPEEFDPWIDQKLGSFRLVRLVGRGSFARVYLGEHTVIGSQVAVKIAEAHVAQDPDLLQRFVGEARAASQVPHENIVRIYDIKVPEGGYPYFVMEYLQGETLADAAARGPMAFLKTAPILLQICAGLGAAHRAGIIHRDLKPEHIFLTTAQDRQVVKIVDFGIARRERLDMGERRTTVGTVLGTPLYMSPEQAFAMAVDGRSDIYSLGVILYQLSTGRLPFQNESLAELLRAHAMTPPAPPRALNLFIEAEYEQLILKCLAKKPEARYSSMAELAQACSQLQSRLSPASRTAPEQRARPALSARPTSAGSGNALLDRIESTDAADLYALIGVSPDAELEAIRAACLSLSAALDPERNSAEPSRLEIARRRVAAAEELLIDPEAKATFDAKQGNYRGVARCLEAGLEDKVLEELHRQHLASRPHLWTMLKPLRARADERERAGDFRGAAEALALALRLDPLDIELHRRHGRARQRAG
ncbi:MAG: protein kinase [Myxococcales bacterium]|nr:protein kinase [Myxococcales bacterium]